MVGNTLMDRYRLDAELGRGGMGVVYRGHDTVLDRPVAVKVLSSSAANEDTLTRWRHEAQAAAKLTHPNIVAVHDAGEASGSPFIIMELVEGVPLSEAGAFDYPSIASIGRQLSAALAHAHASGIIHRDLKPANVIVQQNGQGPKVKLADLGVARLTQSTQLTQEGELLGTASYLAPEQALGQPVDGRADLYSLGVLLYELTTGRLPFEGEDPLAVISQHLYAPLVPPCTWREDIPGDLEQIIMKLLSKEADDRFTSAKEVDEVLEQAKLEGREARNEAEAPTTEPVVLLDRLARGRLTGRRDQLQQLRELWLRAQRGQSHMALVSGEPGVGKTRLSRELLVLARLQGSPVLSGGCYEFEATTPYLPWVEGLRQWVNDTPADRLEEALGTTAAELARLAPEIESKLGPQPAQPELNAQQERMRLFDAFSRFLQSLASRRGLLVFLDDLHWADHGTLQLLYYVLRNLRDDRLLVLGTYREIELDRAHPLSAALVEWNRERLATRIPLDRLSLDDNERMLAAMFGQEKVSGEFAEAIHRETEGNPFFVEEVIKSLIEHGQIYRSEGKWQREEIADLTIPQSIKAAIGRRLNRLSEECVDVLHTAAALGKVFDFEVLAAVSRGDDDAVLDALDEASTAQLVRVESRETFAFTHDKIREVLHEELNPIRQRRLHQRIGESLEKLFADSIDVHASDLAYHFSQGSDIDKGLRYSLTAGREAVKVYAMDEALEHYDRARDCAEALEQKDQLSRIEEYVARVWEASGDLGRAAEFIERALKLNSDADRAFRLRAFAGECYVASDDPRGREHAEGVRQAVNADTDPERAAQALMVLGRYAHHDGEYEKALDLLGRAHELAQRAGNPNLRGWIYTHMAGACQHMGRYQESMDWARKAIRLGEEEDLPAWVASGHEFLAEDNFQLGKFRESIAAAVIDREVGERIGAKDRVAWALFSEAYSCRGLGDLAGAASRAEKSAEMAEQIGEVRLEALANVCLSLVRTEQGRDESALAHAEKALAIGERTGSDFLSAQAEVALIHLHASRSRWDEAMAAHERFESLMKDTQNVNLKQLAAASHCEVLVRSGQLEDAEALIAHTHEWAMKSGSILYEAISLRLLGLLRTAQSRWDEARAAADQAVDMCQKHEISLELGRALLVRAALHASTGNLDTCKADRAQAEEVFQRSGAAADLERLRETLTQDR